MLYTQHLTFGISLCTTNPNNPLNINEVVAAEWASALVAALEPPEQTDGVECVLAGGTALVGGLHVGRDNRVTNGTLALPLESTLHVSPEG